MVKGVVKESAMKKYWEIIADNLHAAGWSYGMISYLAPGGVPMHKVDAHRGEQYHVVHADDLLAAFLELERSCRSLSLPGESAC